MNMVTLIIKCCVAPEGNEVTPTLGSCNWNTEETQQVQAKCVLLQVEAFS